MNNTTSVIAATTSVEDDNKISRDWVDVVLPIMAIGLLILLAVTFSGSFLKCLKACCDSFNNCRDFERPESTDLSHVSGTNNQEYQRGNEDIPPSYSITELGRSSNISFEVIPVDVNEVEPTCQTDFGITDKLPSYLEIMEEKRLEDEQCTRGSRSNTFNREPHLPNERVTRSPHATIDSDEGSSNFGSTLPPPYQGTSSSSSEHA